MSNQKQWVDIIRQALDNLGGVAHRKDIIKAVKIICVSYGREIPLSIEQTIQQTIQANSSDSNSWRKKNDYFYSVSGLERSANGIKNKKGSGEWGLRDCEKENTTFLKEIAYLSGIEGHRKEYKYLISSRNKGLVENRKKFDDNTCQACRFRLEVSDNKFIIDVHHINPLKTVEECVVTNIDDLVCLCPNCHRIAHSQELKPLTIIQIKEILGKIEQDQVADYALRKGITLEEAERLLQPILNY